MNSGVMRICRDRTSSVGRCRGDNMTRELKRANITLSETGLEQYRAPLVAYFLRRVHIRAEAEDLAQEVFARLVERDGGYADESARSYIFAIATNLARDRFRRLRVRGHAATLSGEWHGAYPAALIDDLTPERVLLGRERLRQIDAALAELNDVTREILVALRVGGRRPAEIGPTQRIPRSQLTKPRDGK